MTQDELLGNGKSGSPDGLDFTPFTEEEFDFTPFSVDEFTEQKADVPKGTIGQGIKHGAQEMYYGAKLYTGAAMNAISGDNKADRGFNVMQQLPDPEERKRVESELTSTVDSLTEENKQFLNKYAGLKSRYIDPTEKKKPLEYFTTVNTAAMRPLTKEEIAFLKDNKEKFDKLSNDRFAMSSAARDIRSVEKKVDKLGEEGASAFYQEHQNETAGDRKIKKAEAGMAAIPEMRGVGYNIGKMIPQVAGSAAAIGAAYLTGGSAPLLTQAVGAGTMGYMSMGAAGFAYKHYKDYMTEAGKPVDENTALLVGAGAGMMEYLSERIPFDMVLPKSAMNRIIAQNVAENPQVGIDLIEKWIKKHPQEYADFLKNKGIKGFAATANVEGMSEAAAELGQIAIEAMYKDPEDRATLKETFSRMATSYAAGAAIGGFLNLGSVGVQHRMSYLRHKDGVALATTKDNPGEVFEVLGVRPDRSVILMDNQGNESIVSSDKVDKHIKVNKQELDDLLSAVEQGKGQADQVKREIMTARQEEKVREMTKDYVSEDGRIEILQDAAKPNMQYAYLGRSGMAGGGEMIFIYDPETGQKKGVSPRSVVHTGESQDYETYVRSMTDQAVNEYFQAEQVSAEVDAAENPAEILPGDKLLYQGKEVEVESVFPDGTVRAFDPTQGVGAAFTLSPTDAALLQPVVSGTRDQQSLPEQIEVNGKNVKLESLEDGTTIISKPFLTLEKAQAEAQRLNGLFDAYEFNAIEFKPKDKNRSKRIVVTISEKAQQQDILPQDEVSQEPGLQENATANPAPSAPLYSFDGAEITKARAKAKILKAKDKKDLASLQIGNDAELQGLIDEKFPQVPPRYVYDGREIDRETAVALIEDATTPEELATLTVEGDEEMSVILDGKFAPQTEAAAPVEQAQTGPAPQEPIVAETAQVETAEPVRIVIAPLYNTKVNTVEEARQLRESDEYKQYLESIQLVADVLGVKVAGISENIGGYVMEATGEKIVEISNTVEIDGTLDQAEEFAALMRTMTPEVQEAAYANEYTEPGSESHGIDEVRLKVGDINKAIPLLQEAGIYGFTIDETNSVVGLLDFSKGTDSEFKTNLINFVQSLQNEGVSYESEQRRAINSREVNYDRSREIRERINGDAIRLERGGQNLRDLLAQSEARDSEFRGATAGRPSAEQIASELGVEYLGVQPSGNPDGTGDLDLYDFQGATFSVPKGSDAAVVSAAREALVAKYVKPVETEKTKKRRTRIAEKVAVATESNQAVTDKIKAAEGVTNTKPTESQKEAGNYQKGKVSIQGLEISIENPAGSVREGTDKSGKKWSTKLKNAYGYINRTTGAEGTDGVDVFLGDNPASKIVYIIDQVDQNGKFDEHKVMLGFRSMQEAEAAYVSNYEPGWSNYATITEMSTTQFKEWVTSGDRKTAASPIFTRSKKVIVGMLESWTRKANSSAKLVLVDKQMSLPEHLNDKTAVIDGVYDPKSKQVYIVLDNIKNSSHAAQVWLHEQAIHKGLRTLFHGREDYNNRLRLIYESVKDSDEMAAIRQAYPELDEVGLADEYMAYLGERFLNGDNIESWQSIEASAWNKFNVWFRSVVRTIIPDMKVSEREIASILLDSYRAVHGQTPIFRRANPKKKKSDSVVDRLESGETSTPDVRQRKEIEASPQFKAWFGDSKAVSSPGKPLVMYHGTPHDFTVFNGHGGVAAFVTPDPEFAEEYADGRGSIMPVYVKAENPWDYKDPDHLAMLNEEIDKVIPSPTLQAKAKVNLSKGYWEMIENFTGEIRDLGFDSFYVIEQDTRNLAVFNANQVKSATGNTGDFSITNPDIRYRKASAVGALGKEDRAASRREWRERGVLSSHFKSWFGNWESDTAEGVSEILDEYGWPMVVSASGSDLKANAENDAMILISAGGEGRGYYANVKRPFMFYNEEHIEQLASEIASDENKLNEFNSLRNDFISGSGTDAAILEKATTVAEVEEYIQEAIDINAPEFVSWISHQIKNTGLFDGIVINPDIANFKGLVFDASQLAVNDLTSVDEIAIEEGASAPIGDPIEISDVRHRKSRPAEVREGYKLSHVTGQDIIDIEQLISEIQANKQKVWFWTADQLGRGHYFDTVINGNHFLDAGPSYALDPENRNNGVIWASSAAPKTLQDKANSSDYIFIISGSPTISHGFNKTVFDLFQKRVETVTDYEKFRKDVAKHSTVGDLTKIIKNFHSFDELYKSGEMQGSNPKEKFLPRKRLLEILNDQASKVKESPLTETLRKYNALINLNELRDEYYLENQFDVGDIMLVLKPSGVAQDAGNHSTYLHDILGEVVGVPDKVINSYDLMPSDQMKKAYDDTMSRSMKMQSVAPYGMGIRTVTAERLDVRHRKQLTLPDGTKIPKMIGSRGERFREIVQDRMISLRNLQDEVRKRGGILDETMDAYLEENRSASKSNRAMKNFDKEIMEPLMTKISDITGKTDVTLEELQKYMKAKHAPERNRVLQQKTGREVNSGMETAEAKKYAAEIEARLGAANVTELWKRLRKATDFVMKRYLSDGFITRENYDMIMGNAAKGIPRTYEHYVPLRGWKVKERPEDIFEYLDGVERQSFTPNRTAEGRVTEADDPIAYIQSMAHSAIAAGEKNVVKQHAARMVFANSDESYNDLFYMKKVWVVKTGQVDPATGKEIEVEVTERPDDALFKAGKARFGHNRGSHEAFRTGQMADQHEVDVFIGGDRYTMVFQDPSVANAIAKRNTWAEPLTLFAQKWFGVPTRIMSALMTSKNPAFIPLNLIRDIGYTMTSLTMQADISSKDVFLNYAKAFGSIKRNLYGEGKKFDPVNKETDRLYKEFLDNGGETGFVHLKDIKQLQRELERKVRRLQREAARGKTTVDYLANTFNAVNGQLDNLAALSENASRFAVYMAARNQGKTINQSVDAAKNVTVNFNRKGRITGLVGSFFAFFNASVQGGHNVMRLGRRHSKKFAVGAAMFSALGYALARLNMEWGGEDEEGVPRYQLLSDWVKHTNMIIPDFKNPGRFITIPLPHGFRAFYSLGVLGHQVENGEKTIGQFAGSAMSNFMDGLSPVNVSNFYDKKEGKPTIRPIIPTVGIPIYDVAVNKDFLGNEVYNKPFMSSWDGKIADAKLGKSFVSKPISALTDWLYEIGSKGDNDNTNMYIEGGELKKVSDLYDWNPSKIEHILSGYFGGLGTFGVNLVRTASGIIEAADQAINENADIKDAISESVEINFLPVVNRLYQRPWKDSYMAKYKVIKEQVENYDFEMQQNKRDGDYEDIAKLYDLTDLNTMSMVFNVTKKKITEVMNLAYESGDPDVIADAMEQRERMIQETVAAIENAIGTKIKF